VSCENRSRIIDVEVVIKPVIVLIPLAVVPIQVTDVEVAIRVAVVCGAPPISLPVEYSLGWILFVILNHLALRTKYLHF
jgi:hypothetical protein